MYGWRGRIGLLVPTGNTTNEPEFYKMAPPGVTIHSNRVYLKDVTAAELAAMIGHIEEATRQLSICDLDVVAFGCTSGSFISGPGYDESVMAKMANATTAKVTTTSTAVLAALQAVGAQKIVLATPYTSDINQAELRFLEAAGYEVLNNKGLGLVELRDIMCQHPQTAYRLARSIDSPEADTIFISCTGFPTVDVLSQLELDLGKPVVSSNQATFWHCLKLMNIKDRIENFGSLFSRL